MFSDPPRRILLHELSKLLVSHHCIFCAESRRSTQETRTLSEDRRRRNMWSHRAALLGFRPRIFLDRSERHQVICDYRRILCIGKTVCQGPCLCREFCATDSLGRMMFCRYRRASPRSRGGPPGRALSWSKMRWCFFFSAELQFA